LIATAPPDQVERDLLALKDQIDRANTSTVCDKEELDVPMGWLSFNVVELSKLGMSALWDMVWGRNGYGPAS
jgi:hypothetical protein